MGIRKLSDKKTKDQENFEKIKEKSQLTYFDADKKEVKSLQQIFTKTTEVQEIWMERLGCFVKVGHISMKEFLKLQEKLDPNNPKDQVPLALEMVYLLLKSADKTVTKPMIDDLPYHIATDIIKATTGGDKTGFQGEPILPIVPQDT